MNLIRTGIWLITISVVITGVGSTLVDNIPGTHMTNPLWVPHAKFHDAAMFCFLDGACIMALWLLWRRSFEPGIGTLAAALVVMLFWTPFLYITTLYPQASLVVESPLNRPWHAENYVEWTPKAHQQTRLLFGVIPLYVNVLMGCMMMIMSGIGYTLYRLGVRYKKVDHRQLPASRLPFPV